MLNLNVSYRFGIDLFVFLTLMLTACGGGGTAYSIGGTVSGLTGSLVLQNNGGDNLTISANGPFTFATNVASGSAYNVTVLTQPAGQYCTVNGGRGQVSSASVTNVTVACNGVHVQAIAGGYGHTCALLDNGGVQCWGLDGSGQLGNNTLNNSPVSVAVSGLTSGVQAIAAGSYHTCALINGGVQCWGDNSNGQLGNNSTTNTLVPVAVSGLPSDVLAIAAGGFQTCALLGNGGVQCWGDNVDGQLGNNSTTDSLVPVSVSGLTSGVQAIAMGGFQTCALVNGGIQCWGDNADGQLGNNSLTNSSVPVNVSGL